MIAIIALLLPICAAWSWLDAFGPRLASRPLPLIAAYAFCIGVGASSLTTFAVVLAWGGLPPWFAPVDAVLWVALTAIALRLRRQREARSEPPSPHGRPRLAGADARVTAVFLAVAALTMAATASGYFASPYGAPDATLMWNLKARFLVLGDSEWSAFSMVPWANPSHPLLVSLSVARLWSYTGAHSTLTPVLVGVGSALASAGAIVGALHPRTTRALVAVCLLSAPVVFTAAIPAQTADLPLGAFLVVALVAMPGVVDAARPREAAAYALAGLSAGFVAWTKNEGLVFLCVLFAVAAAMAVRMRTLRPVVAFAGGALPAVAAVAAVKLILAPVLPEYFAGPELVASAPQRLLDPSRIAIVSRGLWDHWLAWGGWPGAGLLPVATLAAVGAACTRQGRPARLVLMVAAVMVAAYAGAWLLSTLDLAWLVSSTADRLLLQLWPALVLAVFVVEYGDAAASDVAVDGSETGRG